MSVYEFSLANLPHLDEGRLALAFQQAITRAVADCEDRPGEGKGRSIALVAEIVPVMFDNHLDTVNVSFQVKESLPTRKSKTYNMGVRKGGKLVFNDLSDDNIHQRTIDEE